MSASDWYRGHRYMTNITFTHPDLSQTIVFVLSEKSPGWKSWLLQFDYFTVYHPFEIINHYFQPHSTGPSMAFLLASILIVVMYASNVAMRNNDQSYLSLRQIDNSEEFKLPAPFEFDPEV